MTVRVLALIALTGAILFGEPGLTAPDTIVANYCAASRERETALNGASMEIKIDASLPRLKKQGRLRALRHISKLGRITYDALRFEGDNTVKSNVITRYLTAEAQAQNGSMPSLAVSPENYKFKYKHEDEWEGRRVHVFQVTPRKKRVGLYKGEIWIDAGTYLRVRESGRFVKNPSIFLKKVEFVRKYAIRDGISVPRELDSVVDTRLVGRAELKVEYSNLLLPQDTRAGVTDFGDQ